MFSVRGAVNAEPEICSAYKPYGHFCGEFCPFGSASGQRESSDVKYEPKPH